MVAPFRPDLSAFPNSPYAAELEHGGLSRYLNPKFEAEYVRAQLLGKRTLIRVACTLAALLAAFRGTEQAFAGWWDQAHLIAVALVLTSSIALAAIARALRRRRVRSRSVRRRW